MVSVGSSTTLPSVSRTGYTFSGWNTHADGTGTNYNANASYTPTGDITLYAQWTFTVTYTINGGAGMIPASQTVDPGSSIILFSDTGFSRTGYIFDGWNTNTSGTGMNYNVGDSFTPTENITLYAKWNDWYTTVTYDINNGTGTIPSVQTVRQGTVITLHNDNGFIKAGFDFDGWNTNDSGTGTNHNAGTSYTVNADITLYAKWSTTNPGTNGLEYELINNNTEWRVKKGTITSGEVIIPSYHFYDSTGTYLPVTEIGSYAFGNCGLTDITIPNSVTTIWHRAFSSCTSLTSVTIGSGVTSIDVYAFDNCTSLTSVTFANGSQLQTIGSYAFRGCGLTSIIIPNSVTSIGGDAFSGCRSLTNVTFASDSQLQTIGSYAFGNCGLTDITIPNSVTSIWHHAFSSCTSLTSVTIGSGVTSIDVYAFDNCTSLTNVTFASTISSANFGNRNFEGDLRDKYLAEGIGTYTRAVNGTTWTKW
jgi:uncharacterized repeat protein (TIGR02543 family)